MGGETMNLTLIHKIIILGFVIVVRIETINRLNQHKL